MSQALHCDTIWDTPEMNWATGLKFDCCTKKALQLNVVEHATAITGMMHVTALNSPGTDEPG